VIEQPAEGLQGLAVRNNLFLAERGPDLVFVGRGQGALASWRIEQNWRLVQPPAPDDPQTKECISAAMDRVGPVSGLSLDLGPSFLRPAKDSPLATGGAGGDLPSYVGAVPPEGV
jgi:hypothetical protein